MNKKYEDIKNLENIDAITDRIDMDRKFLAELICSREKVEAIINKNGFNLSGECYSVFETFVNSIKIQKNNIFKEEKV